MYFQTMATTRKQRNTVWEMKDEHGNLFNDQ